SAGQGDRRLEFDRIHRGGADRRRPGNPMRPGHLPCQGAAATTAKPGLRVTPDHCHDATMELGRKRWQHRAENRRRPDTLLLSGSPVHELPDAGERTSAACASAGGTPCDREILPAAVGAAVYLDQQLGVPLAGYVQRDRGRFSLVAAVDDVAILLGPCPDFSTIFG